MDLLKISWSMFLFSRECCNCNALPTGPRNDFRNDFHWWGENHKVLAGIDNHRFDVFGSKRISVSVFLFSKPTLKLLRAMKVKPARDIESEICLTPTTKKKVSITGRRAWRSCGLLRLYSPRLVRSAEVNVIILLCPNYTNFRN
jgi:hypothetical protein